MIFSLSDPPQTPEQSSVLSSKGTMVYRCHQTWSSMTDRRDVGHWRCSVRMPLGRRWADTSSISALVNHRSLSLTSSWGNQQMGEGVWEACRGERGEGEGRKGRKKKGGQENMRWQQGGENKHFSRWKKTKIYSSEVWGSKCERKGEKEFSGHHACFRGCHYVLAPIGILPSMIARWLIVFRQWNKPTVN